MAEQAVDVISLCSADGSLSPLRLRMEDIDRGAMRMDIDRVMRMTHIDTVGAEGVLYLCRATAGGRQWVVELRYAIRTHTWYMTRCSS